MARQNAKVLDLGFLLEVATHPKFSPPVSRIPFRQQHGFRRRLARCPRVCARPKPRTVQAVAWTALPTAWQFVVDPVEQTGLPSLPVFAVTSTVAPALNAGRTVSVTPLVPLTATVDTISGIVTGIGRMVVAVTVKSAVSRVAGLSVWL